MELDERARVAVLQGEFGLLAGTAAPMPAPVAGAGFIWRHLSWKVVQRRAEALRISLENAVDLEAAHGTPFLFMAVFLGAGAAIYFTHDSEPGWMAMLAVAAILSLFWFMRIRAGRRGWFAGALLCLVLGSLFAKVETMRHSGVMLAGGVTANMELRVLRADRDGRQTRVLAAVLSTANPQLKFQPNRIRLSLSANQPAVRAGDILSGRVGLRALGGPVRPGSYDFAFHGYFSGIGANGFAMGQVSVRHGPSVMWIDSVRFGLESIRVGIADRVRSAIPGTAGHVSAALIAGVTGGIDEANEEALRITGLAHILSISGLHMALVAGAVMVAIRLTLALFPAFAAGRPIKKWAAGAALVASFFYLLLSGGQVATMRAFIMLAVMLVAVLLDRQALTLRNLAIAAILILVTSPHEIMGPSFQMSFAATAALISAYAWMSSRREESTPVLQGSWQKAKSVAMAAILTPLVAGLATAIFSAWHFHRLAPMGLPANLAAMPVVSFVVMPFALIGTLLMPFGLEGWPLAIMGKGVDMMLAIARWFADRSPEDTSGAMPPMAFVALTAGFMILTLCKSHLRLAGLAAVPLAASIVAVSRTPDVYVSEDARLIALRTASGDLAVNRVRPSQFTSNVWRNASAARIMVKPEVTTVASAIPEIGSKTGADPFAAATEKPDVFHCISGLCATTSSTGFRIAWFDPEGFSPPEEAATQTGKAPFNPSDSVDAEKPEEDDRRLPETAVRAFFKACDWADLVVTASAIPFRSCDQGWARLIRADTFARTGAAELRFVRSEPKNGRPGNDQFEIQATFAIGEPNRPWNRERIFSRAARNIPDRPRKTATNQKLESRSAPVAKQDADQSPKDDTYGGNLADHTIQETPSNP